MAMSRPVSPTHSDLTDTTNHYRFKVTRSPKFEKILENLANEDDRRILTEFIEAMEIFKRDYLQALRSNSNTTDILTDLNNLKRLVERFPGLTSEDLVRLTLVHLDAQRQNDRETQMINDTLAETRKRLDQAEIGNLLKEAHQKYDALHPTIMRKVRDTYHNLQGLSPNELREIDDAFDNMEQGESVIHKDSEQRFKRLYREKIGYSSIPRSLVMEALELLDEANDESE